MTDELEKLLKLFKESRTPLTAKRIAKKTGTYPATAKRRVEALISEGVKIKEVQCREGRRGFASTAWTLVG